MSYFGKPFGCELKSEGLPVEALLVQALGNEGLHGQHACLNALHGRIGRPVHVFGTLNNTR